MRQTQIWHQIFLYQKNVKTFQWLSKSKFLSFMTKVNPNNGNETKSDIFPRDIFKSDIIFIGHKILKYFNDFNNWQFSISFQKWTQSSKVKQNHKGHVQIWQHFFIYKVVHSLNDFWNLFFDKVYHLGHHKNV